MNDEEGHIDPGVGMALALEKIREEAVKAAAAVDWRDRPFPRGDTTFMIYMTAEEWELAYSLTLAWMDQGELQALALAEQFRAVIQRLQEQCGYTWDGLRHAEDGELYATVRMPVEGNNILSIMLLHGGSPPDYEVHLSNSIDYCLIRERITQLIPLLKETLARVRIALEKTPRPTKREKRALRKRMKFEEKAAIALKNKIMEAEIIH